MTTTLDATGYNCPIPVLKTRKALKDIPAGELLRVLASDPASAIDMPHFCNTTGHELVETRLEQGVYSYVIRKAAPVKKPEQA